MNTPIPRILFCAIHQHTNFLRAHAQLPRQQRHPKRLKTTLRSQHEIRPELLLRFVRRPGAERELQHAVVDVFESRILDERTHFC